MGRVRSVPSTTVGGKFYLVLIGSKLYDVIEYSVLKGERREHCDFIGAWYDIYIIFLSGSKMMLEDWARSGF